MENIWQRNEIYWVRRKFDYFLWSCGDILFSFITPKVMSEDVVK